MGAFYCRDEKMLQTYRAGGDIHAATTSVIFHVPFSEAADKNAPHYKGAASTELQLRRVLRTVSERAAKDAQIQGGA